MTRLAILLSAAALVGCAAQPASVEMAAAAPEPATEVAAVPGVNPFETPRERIVPIIDAHQHMMSELAMTTIAPRLTPPPIKVPAAITALLEARTRPVTGDNYASVFTEDAHIFSLGYGRWYVGRAQVLDAASQLGSETRFEPTSYSASGSTAYVSGVTRNAEDGEVEDFTFGLRKGPRGNWLIASEMVQRIMPPIYAPQIDAERVIDVLDDAGIRYATVLSVGFWFGKPSLTTMSGEERWANMRAENDWTIAQTQKYPDRLLPFCGVNPELDFAIAELERCAKIPAVRGIKIHRNNSRLDLDNPETLAKVQAFFRAANRLKMPIVIHLARDPAPWIDKVFTQAPDIPIQIAHMASDWSFAKVFAEAIQASKPGTANLWFDWTQAGPIEGWWGYGPSEWMSGKLTPSDAQEHVDIMRRLKLGRILYGTDMPLSWNPTPREWWRKTILALPLTDDEVRDIADNLPPYVACRIECGK